VSGSLVKLEEYYKDRIDMETYLVRFGSALIAADKKGVWTDAQRDQLRDFLTGVARMGNALIDVVLANQAVPGMNERMHKAAQSLFPPGTKFPRRG